MVNTDEALLVCILSWSTEQERAFRNAVPWPLP